MKHLRFLLPAMTLTCALSACDPASPSDAGVDGGTDAGPFDAGPIAPVPSLAFEPIALEGDPQAVSDFVFVPGTSDELLLTELAGTVRHYRLAGDSATLLGSFTIDTVLQAECGLISIAIDPEFTTNHFVYLGHCTSAQASRVSRIELEPGAYDEAWATAQLIVEVEERAAPDGWHNVGAMDFEEGSRVLWVLFGDKTQADQSQDTSQLNGKLLRIVPSVDPSTGGYEPAAGNPFADDGGDPAVYAYGLRTPWRAARDAFGRWWIGDVGNHIAEEVNLVDRPGLNFGWPEAEGPCEGEGCGGRTDPIRYYSHGSGDDIFFDDPEIAPTEVRAVWVGPAYAARFEDRYEGQLTNRVLWGDFAMGFVRVLEVLPSGEVRADANVGHLQGAAAWREAPDGYVYAASFGSVDPTTPAPGALYRAVLQ